MNLKARYFDGKLITGTYSNQSAKVAHLLVFYLSTSGGTETLGNEKRP